MRRPVTVSINGVSSSQIVSNRPSWSAMKDKYPPDGVSKYDFYPLISKALAHSVDAPAYANSCALRMSYALNQSGVRLGKPPGKGGGVIGDDGLTYWLRVRDLKKRLFVLFNNADFTLKYPNKMPKPSMADSNADVYAANHPAEYSDRILYAENEFITKIRDKTGIIVFDVQGWGDATGHFTLWEKGNLLYVGANQSEKDPSSPFFYMWHLDTRYDAVKDEMKLIETTAVYFWELI